MKVLQKKICMLGSFSVGKTSLVRRFVYAKFEDKYLSTVGVNISRKSITRSADTVNLILWDLAGGDDYSPPKSNYLAGLAGALIVCDLTRPQTLPAYELYADQVRAHKADVPLVFIANKVDLVDERAISDEDLEALCRKLGGPYLLTSAKTGEQVEAAFQLLADKL